jgi:hypothetical protein
VSPEPVAVPTPAALDGHAAVLREQAAGLCRQPDRAETGAAGAPDLADHLEHKARMLELGAGELRAAEWAFTTQERTEHLGRAKLALDAAEAVTLDLGRSDARRRAAAARRANSAPGAEPAHPGPAAAGRPDHADHAGPAGLAGPADLVEPDPEPDPVLLDALERARAELAGDPDPFGEVPEAGDFGLPPADVAAARTAVAEAPADFGDDNYMDQPDVGSTSAVRGAPST